MKIDQIPSGAKTGIPVQPLRLAERASGPLFQIVVLLGLTGPSLTKGPFAWLPVFRVRGAAPLAVALGPLVLLVPLALGAWVLARVSRPAHGRWWWGRLGVTLPLLGLTLLMLFSLHPTANRRTALVLLLLGILWWVYLFVINESANLTAPLALTIVIQSAVAVGQFALQRDLGLQMLGELALDPELSGTCVLFAGEQRWLRAYGLTGHPNVLGHLLSVLLLLVIDDVGRARGWRKGWFALVGGLGLLGLLTSFSRAAWLGFGAGLVCWATRSTVSDDRWPTRPREFRPSRVVQAASQHVQVLVPAVLGIAFLIFFHDLVASRFLELESPIEARSIRDRGTDTELALRVIARHPWLGVGVQNYLPAVRAIEPDSRIVHNVALLTAAELGLSGALLWLVMVVSGLAQTSSIAWPAWIAMLIGSLFDIPLFPVNSLYAAIAFGILAAHTSRPSRAADASESVCSYQGGG